MTDYGQYYQLTTAPEITPFNTLQGRMVLKVEELVAATNPEDVILSAAAQASADLMKIWAKHAPHLIPVAAPVSEEGQ